MKTDRKENVTAFFEFEENISSFTGDSSFIIISVSIMSTSVFVSDTVLILYLNFLISGHNLS